MNRKLVIPLFVIVALLFNVTAAFAGNPHFVGTPTVSPLNAPTVTVSVKEAGLGDESQIVATLSGTAECINGGGNHPKAVNKASFSTSATEPVQNGQASYTMTLTATFSPNCSPPMTVRWSNLTLTDTTNGLTVRF